jgi:hypothetical protein
MAVCDVDKAKEQDPSNTIVSCPENRRVDEVVQERKLCCVVVCVALKFWMGFP